MDYGQCKFPLENIATQGDPEQHIVYLIDVGPLLRSAPKDQSEGGQPADANASRAGGDRVPAQQVIEVQARVSAILTHLNNCATAVSNRPFSSEGQYVYDAVAELMKNVSSGADANAEPVAEDTRPPYRAHVAMSTLLNKFDKATSYRSGGASGAAGAAQGTAAAEGAAAAPSRIQPGPEGSGNSSWLNNVAYHVRLLAGRYAPAMQAAAAKREIKSYVCAAWFVLILAAPPPGLPVDPAEPFPPELLVALRQINARFLVVDPSGGADETQEQRMEAAVAAALQSVEGGQGGTEGAAPAEVQLARLLCSHWRSAGPTQDNGLAVHPNVGLPLLPVAWIPVRRLFTHRADPGLDAMVRRLVALPGPDKSALDLRSAQRYVEHFDFNNNRKRFAWTWPIGVGVAATLGNMIKTSMLLKLDPLKVSIESRKPAAVAKAAPAAALKRGPHASQKPQHRPPMMPTQPPALPGRAGVAGPAAGRTNPGPQNVQGRAPGPAGGTVRNLTKPTVPGRPGAPPASRPQAAPVAVTKPPGPAAPKAPQHKQPAKPLRRTQPDPLALAAAAVNVNYTHSRAAGKRLAQALEQGAAAAGGLGGPAAKPGTDSQAPVAGGPAPAAAGGEVGSRWVWPALSAEDIAAQAARQADMVEVDDKLDAGALLQQADERMHAFIAGELKAAVRRDEKRLRRSQRGQQQAEQQPDGNRATVAAAASVGEAPSAAQPQPSAAEPSAVAGDGQQADQAGRKRQRSPPHDDSRAAGLSLHERQEPPAAGAAAAGLQMQPPAEAAPIAKRQRTAGPKLVDARTRAASKFIIPPHKLSRHEQPQPGWVPPMDLILARSREDAKGVVSALLNASERAVSTALRDLKRQAAEQAARGTARTKVDGELVAEVDPELGPAGAATRPHDSTQAAPEQGTDAGDGDGVYAAAIEQVYALLQEAWAGDVMSALQEKGDAWRRPRLMLSALLYSASRMIHAIELLDCRRRNPRQLVDLLRDQLDHAVPLLAHVDGCPGMAAFVRERLKPAWAKTWTAPLLELMAVSYAGEDREGVNEVEFFRRRDSYDDWEAGMEDVGGVEAATEAPSEPLGAPRQAESELRVSGRHPSGSLGAGPAARGPSGSAGGAGAAGGAAGARYRQLHGAGRLGGAGAGQPAPQAFGAANGGKDQIVEVNSEVGVVMAGGRKGAGGGRMAKYTTKMDPLRPAHLMPQYVARPLLHIPANPPPEKLAEMQEEQRRKRRCGGMQTNLAGLFDKEAAAEPPTHAPAAANQAAAAAGAADPMVAAGASAAAADGRGADRGEGAPPGAGCRAVAARALNNAGPAGGTPVGRGAVPAPSTSTTEVGPTPLDECGGSRFRSRLGEAGGGGPGLGLARGLFADEEAANGPAIRYNPGGEGLFGQVATFQVLSRPAAAGAGAAAAAAPQPHVAPSGPFVPDAGPAVEGAIATDAAMAVDAGLGAGIDGPPGDAAGAEGADAPGADGEPGAADDDDEAQASPACRMQAEEHSADSKNCSPPSSARDGSDSATSQDSASPAKRQPINIPDACSPSHVSGAARGGPASAGTSAGTGGVPGPPQGIRGRAARGTGIPRLAGGFAGPATGGVGGAALRGARMAGPAAAVGSGRPFRSGLPVPATGPAARRLPAGATPRAAGDGAGQRAQASQDPAGLEGLQAKLLQAQEERALQESAAAAAAAPMPMDLEEGDPAALNAPDPDQSDEDAPPQQQHEGSLCAEPLQPTSFDVRAPERTDQSAAALRESAQAQAATAAADVGPRTLVPAGVVEAIAAEAKLAVVASAAEAGMADAFWTDSFLTFWPPSGAPAQQCRQEALAPTLPARQPCDMTIHPAPRLAAGDSAMDVSLDSEMAAAGPTDVDAQAMNAARPLEPAPIAVPSAIVAPQLECKAPGEESAVGAGHGAEPMGEAPGDGLDAAAVTPEEGTMGPPVVDGRRVDAGAEPAPQDVGGAECADRTPAEAAPLQEAAVANAAPAEQDVAERAREVTDAAAAADLHAAQQGQLQGHPPSAPGTGYACSADEIMEEPQPVRPLEDGPPQQAYPELAQVPTAPSHAAAMPQSAALLPYDQGLWGPGEGADATAEALAVASLPQPASVAAPSATDTTEAGDGRRKSAFKFTSVLKEAEAMLQEAPSPLQSRQQSAPEPAASRAAPTPAALLPLGADAPPVGPAGAAVGTSQGTGQAADPMVASAIVCVDPTACAAAQGALAGAGEPDEDSQGAAWDEPPPKRRRRKAAKAGSKHQRKDTGDAEFEQPDANLAGGEPAGCAASEAGTELAAAPADAPPEPPSALPMLSPPGALEDGAGGGAAPVVTTTAASLTETLDGPGGSAAAAAAPALRSDVRGEEDGAAGSSQPQGAPASGTPVCGLPSASPNVQPDLQQQYVHITPGEAAKMRRQAAKSATPGGTSGQALTTNKQGGRAPSAAAASTGGRAKTTSGKSVDRSAPPPTGSKASHRSPAVAATAAASARPAESTDAALQAAQGKKERGRSKRRRANEETDPSAAAAGGSAEPQSTAAAHCATVASTAAADGERAANAQAVASTADSPPTDSKRRRQDAPPPGVGAPEDRQGDPAVAPMPAGDGGAAGPAQPEVPPSAAAEPLGAEAATGAEEERKKKKSKKDKASSKSKSRSRRSKDPPAGEGPTAVARAVGAVAEAAAAAPQPNAPPGGTAAPSDAAALGRTAAGTAADGAAADAPSAQVDAQIAAAAGPVCTAHAGAAEQGPLFSPPSTAATASAGGSVRRSTRSQQRHAQSTQRTEDPPAEGPGAATLDTASDQPRAVTARRRRGGAQLQEPLPTVSEARDEGEAGAEASRLGGAAGGGDGGPAGVAPGDGDAGEEAAAEEACRHEDGQGGEGEGKKSTKRRGGRKDGGSKKSKKRGPEAVQEDDAAAEGTPPKSTAEQQRASPPARGESSPPGSRMTRANASPSLGTRVTTRSRAAAAAGAALPGGKEGGAGTPESKKERSKRATKGEGQESDAEGSPSVRPSKKKKKH